MRAERKEMILQNAPRLWNHMPQIMKTKIKLFDLAAAEKDSLEARLAELDGLLDEGQQGQDLLGSRRRIFAGLIGTTGGGDEAGVPFEDLHLENFSGQIQETENIETHFTLLGITQALAERFVAEHPEMALKIAEDSEYKDNPKKYDNIGNYISRGVGEMLGIAGL